MAHAYMLIKPRTLELQELPDPSLGPRDVRLRSVLSGISHGTEMNLYRGTAPFAEKHFDREYRLFMPNEEPGFRPMRLGYEMVSRVVEVGQEVREVRVGDLVHTATPHGTATVVNLDEDAGKEIPMQALPSGVSPEQGVFAALIGVALAAVHDAQIKVGDHVAVFGLGAIGLLVAQLARLNGASHIVAIDPIARRRHIAEGLGVDDVIDPTVRDPGKALKMRTNAPHGADVAIEASGHYAGLQGALRAAHMGGTVVTLGYYQGGATPVCLGEEWHHNRLNLVSSMAVWGCPSRFHPMWDRQRISRTAIELLARGALQVEEMVTQRYPYQEAPQAYRFIDERPEETIKVVLEYSA
jgi:2-desacetyl-2-hydroxyethyl bacteriochlorophyllide A dehydrogenase